MAVGENGMHGQGRSAGSAALEDSEEELLVVARDADEARKTGLDNLSEESDDVENRKEVEDGEQMEEGRLRRPLAVLAAFR
jgi:hypothetical protein